jgi:hypothetical protein
MGSTSPDVVKECMMKGWASEIERWQTRAFKFQQEIEAILQTKKEVEAKLVKEKARCPCLQGMKNHLADRNMELQAANSRLVGEVVELKKKGGCECG